MPVISVIVPVYNTEKYLKRCIDSILMQSFTDFELILSDDGSTDRSGVICDEYMVKDARVKVIHKRNTGVSDTRNAALDKACGKFVAFIDSDDTVESDMFTVALQAMLNTRSDCVDFGGNKLDKNGELLFTIQHETGTFYYPEEKDKFDFLIRKILFHKIGWEVCFRLFRNDIIQRYRIRFNKNNVFGEDLFFTSVYALHSEKCVSLPNRLYNYYDNDNSAMSKRRKIVALNEVNSLSFYLYHTLKSDTVYLDEYAPFIHYLILMNQFQKTTTDDIPKIREWVENFKHLDFHKDQIKKLLEKIKNYEVFFEKKDIYLFKKRVYFLNDFNEKKYKKALKIQKIRNLFSKIINKIKG